MNAVMVVEDEQLIAKDIADTLTHLGYDVRGTLSSGEACVRVAESCRPDLVVMDIRLKGNCARSKSQQSYNDQGSNDE